MGLSVNGAFALIDSSLVIGGAVVEGLIGVTYNTGREKTNNYGANGKVYSRSRKSRTHEGSITLFYREVLNICRSAQASDLSDVPPFDMQFLVRSSDGDTSLHVFKDVEFLSQEVTMERDGDDTEVEVPIIYSELIVTHS